MPKWDECGIYEADCRNGTCTHQKGKEMAKQTVWLSVSEETPMGVLLWMVYDVSNEEKFTELHKSQPQIYIPCVDGNYISAYCYHFFTKNAALKFLKADEEPRFFEYKKIGGNW